MDREMIKEKNATVKSPVAISGKRMECVYCNSGSAREAPSGLGESQT